MGGLQERIIFMIVSTIFFSIIRTVTGFVLKLAATAALILFLYYLYTNGEFDSILSTISLIGEHGM